MIISTSSFIYNVTWSDKQLVHSFKIHCLIDLINLEKVGQGRMALVTQKNVVRFQLSARRRIQKYKKDSSKYMTVDLHNS